jgi:hypothetical protein
MAQKKKSPYQRAQRQFVQARAQEKGFEEMTPDQREQLRNRFAQLAQTKAGRTTIAQKVLSQATPEQRKELKQRIAQNLPSRSAGTTSTTPVTSTGQQRMIGPMPSQVMSREEQRMVSNRGRATTRPLSTQAPKGPSATSGAASRFGRGLREVGASFRNFGTGVVQGLESAQATFVAPYINRPLRGAAKVTNRVLDTNIKAPQYRTAGGKEALTNVALAAADIALTPAAGAAIRGVGRAALSSAGRRAGRGVVGTGLRMAAESSAEKQLAINALRAAERTGALSPIRTAGRGTVPTTAKKAAVKKAAPVAKAAPAKKAPVAKAAPAVKTAPAKKAPAAKKLPRTKKAPIAKPEPARRILTEQEKVDIVRSPEFGAAIEKASGGQLKPAPVETAPVVKAAPAKKAPPAKKPPAAKKAPVAKKPPVAKKAPAQPAVEPAKKPTGSRTVEASVSRTGVVVREVPDVGEVSSRVYVPKQKGAQRVSSKSMSPEAQAKFWKNEEKQMLQARQDQIKSYGAPSSKPRQDILGDIKPSPAADIEVPSGYEYFSQQFPNMSRAQFRQAQRNAGRAAGPEDVQRSIRDIMSGGDITPGEAARVDLESKVTKAARDAVTKRKKAQTRATQRKVKKLREEKGPWKGI